MSVFFDLIVCPTEWRPLKSMHFISNAHDHASPEILDISSPLTKSAVFHILKKIKHGGREDSNGKEADFVRNFTQFKLC